MARLGRTIPRRLRYPATAAFIPDTGPGPRTASDYIGIQDEASHDGALGVSATDTLTIVDAVVPAVVLDPSIPRPVLRTFEDGDIPTADDLNAYPANIDTLYTVLHSAFRTEQRPITLLRITRDNAEAATGVATAMVWDIADIDTANMWSGKTNHRVTCQRPGLYTLGVQVVLGPNASTAAGIAEAWITVNGTVIPTNAVAHSTAPQVSACGVFTTTEIPLRERDVVRFWVRHNAGATIPVSPLWGGTKAWCIWNAPLDASDVVLDPEPTTPTGGGGGGTFTSPGAASNIGAADGKNHFNLGVGYSPGDDPQGDTAAVHRDYSQAQLEAGFAEDGYYELNAGSTGVEMSVPLDGGRTSANTSYPRVEYREFDRDGTTRAAWNGGSGTHWMEGKTKVTGLSASLTKPWVCIFQIHDAEDDIIRVQVEGTSTAALKLVARYSAPGGGSETTTTLKDPYTVGTEVAWRIEVVNGAGKIVLDGVQVMTFGCNTTGCYFKTGAYAQTNSTLEGGAANGPIVVELRDLAHWHTGWPTPTVGGTTSPGTGGGGGGGTSSVIPASATLLGTLNFDTGNFSQWGTIQCDGYNASASGWGGGRPLAIVNDGTGHGSAARYEVRSGDSAASGERSEARAGSAHNVVEGDERYYSWSTKFNAGFPSPTGGWCIVMQWHAGDGSPPLAIEYSTSGQLTIGNNRSGENYRLNVAPADPGNWHDYVLHAKFSNSSSTGFIRMWRDGAEVLPKTFRKTMASSSNYLKMGLYRGPMSGTQIVFHDGLLIYRP